MLDQIELPASFDAHVHLRDGAMMETVVPTIRQGGANTVYVMVSSLLVCLEAIR
jgi:dihydroorotase